MFRTCLDPRGFEGKYMENFEEEKKKRVEAFTHTSKFTSHFSLLYEE